MTTSKFIAMERRVKDLIKEKQILEQKLQDINDKMRRVQLMNNEEEWQEMDESYEECVSPFSQDSEGSFVLSPNTIKVRCQPRKSESEKCLAKKDDSAIEWESRQNDNDNDSEGACGYARKDETCECDLAKACVSPPNDEICDCEIVTRKSQQIYNENLCVAHLKDDECDGEILNGKSQQADNGKHGVYPVKSQICSNETKIDARGVERELRQTQKEETSACRVTTKPCEYDTKTHKRGSEAEMRQADNNNDEKDLRDTCECEEEDGSLPQFNSEMTCPYLKKSKPIQCEAEKDQRSLKWTIPQIDSDELCVLPAKPANQCECNGKEDQREPQSKLSQSDSNLQKMTRVAYAFKDKLRGYQAKKDQRLLKWCNPLIDNEKPPRVYSAKTEPCEYRAKKDQEGSEWKLRQKDNDNKKTCAYVTCAYGEEKDQQALEWDIPQADDEKKICFYPLKTDACEYEKKKDQSSALEWELRKSSSVCSSKPRTSSECGTKPDQLPMKWELRERQPAVNDNEQSCAYTLGAKSSECGAKEEGHSTFQGKLRAKDNNRDLFNTLKKEYEERFAYLEEELRNYHASVLTGNDKISTMDQRIQTVIREKQILEQKLKQSHSGQEQLDVLRKHYEDRITRLEQDLHNYQLSANTHNSKIAELEERMQCLVKEKQLLEEEVKQKKFDMEKTVLDDNKLALRPADDRDRIFELEKSMQALLKEKEFLEQELKQKGCNTANNDRLKDELHDCKRIVRRTDDEITKLEERMQKLKQEKELLELAFKKKEDQLRALQEKEKCNDNEHTQKEFDVCKRKAEAAVAKAAALDERIKTLGQEKEFLESKLRINFLDLCDFLKEIESVQEVRCKECGRVKNLYICLSCGHFGCCRETGAHALAHYRATKHNLAKKMGSALAYNYECQKSSQPASNVCYGGASSISNQFQAPHHSSASTSNAMPSPSSPPTYLYSAKLFRLCFDHANDISTYFQSICYGIISKSKLCVYHERISQCLEP
uniref:UBP-type domain-containing protein n=1 Tax=Glossina morsitans morsitans TaxID=37546 RepID=A0A1B0G7Z2_GLOMM